MPNTFCGVYTVYMIITRKIPFPCFQLLTCFILLGVLLNHVYAINCYKLKLAGQAKRLPSNIISNRLVSTYMYMFIINYSSSICTPAGNIRINYPVTVDNKKLCVQDHSQEGENCYSYLLTIDFSYLPVFFGRHTIFKTVSITK